MLYNCDFCVVTPEQTPSSNSDTS